MFDRMKKGLGLAAGAAFEGVQQRKPKRPAGKVMDEPYDGGAPRAQSEPARGGGEYMEMDAPEPGSSQYGPSNRTRQANRYDRIGVEGPPYPPAERDEGARAAAKKELWDTWNTAMGDAQQERVTERWRQKMRQKGYSEEEIDQIIAETEEDGGHGYPYGAR